MDDIVRRAMEKWPDVPALFHWLTLDGRGQWRLRDERIHNPNLVDFLGRNYASDGAGRWFIQNGPQRVFVTLEAAPWILRINNGTMTSHTGVLLKPNAMFMDEDGHLYALTDRGLGKIDDRDLTLLADDIVETADGGLSLRFDGAWWPVTHVMQKDMPARFGYVPVPSEEVTDEPKAQPRP